MLTDPEKTVVLGAEHDERTRAALKDVLTRLGGTGLTHQWVVGGSQEVETVEARVLGQRLLIEAETYIGLSIKGPPNLVDQIHELVIAALGRRT